MSETKHNWRIEYEIPPLRAIYHAEADDCTEAEVRQLVAETNPLWRIRKVTPIPNGRPHSSNG